MDLINENLISKEGSFYEKLAEEGHFDFDEFSKLVFYISEINNSMLNEEQRLKISLNLWRLFFWIQKIIGHNFHENDVYKIENLTMDQQVELSNSLGYICNSLLENCDLDVDYILEPLKNN
jgi:hypothetical protein